MGEHWLKQKAGIGCWIPLPAAPTQDLGHWNGTGFRGQLLWTKLAENLAIMSETDHGKTEGMCASGSLAATKCDLMTSDPMPTWRLGKLNHGREGQNLLPLSGS